MNGQVSQEAVLPAWNDSCMIDSAHASGPESSAGRLLPPCSPVAANDNFAGAVTLTLGAASIAGSTCGSLEANEKTACNASADQSVWYKFTATAATTYVEIVNGGSCYIGSSVWPGSTLPTDLCTLINCQAAANGPATTVYQVATSVGRTYAVQVTYSSGMVCGSAGSFSIRATNTVPASPVSNPPPPTNCSTAPAGCYFTSTPGTVSAVTSACTGYPLTSQTNLVVSGLYSFHTAATNSIQLSNQIVLNSTCVNGNIAWGLYKIFDANCNVISCGNIAGGNLNNVACNTTYFIQYMWEELSCTYNTMWPYQFVPTGTVGCGTLPVDWLSFNAYAAESAVELEWTTATEQYNRYFVVERSTDDRSYLPIGSVEGSGTSSVATNYRFTDNHPLSGAAYYRIRQTDMDGAISYSETVFVDSRSEDHFIFYPNPADERISFVPPKAGGSRIRVCFLDVYGCKKFEQIFSSDRKGSPLEIDVSGFTPGVYSVIVESPTVRNRGRVVIK
jgi:hypothetical protein